MSEHRSPGASKRARMLRAAVGRVVDAAPAVPRFVDCRGTTRRDRHRTALTGCREKLAEIRVKDGAVVFVVLAPVTLAVDGVWVLERTAQPGHPEALVHDAGRRATFRCARCGKDTSVDLRELAKVARHQP